MKDSPSLIEAHKTLDNTAFFKLSDLHQILEVSDREITDAELNISSIEVKNEAIPAFDDIDNSGIKSTKKQRKENDFTMEHGLTAPMAFCKEKFEAKKTEGLGNLSKEMLQSVGDVLVELEAEVAKRERSAEEAGKPYVYDELVDELPFMKNWDDVTTLDQGTDDFKSSAAKIVENALKKQSGK